MSVVPIEIGHELTVAGVSDKSRRQGNRLWLLFASKMNCSPCIRLAVSLHPLRNLPATSAAFSLLSAKREMLITNCRLNRIRCPISRRSLHLAYFSLQRKPFWAFRKTPKGARLPAAVVEHPLGGDDVGDLKGAKGSQQVALYRERRNIVAPRRKSRRSGKPRLRGLLHNPLRAARLGEGNDDITADAPSASPVVTVEIVTKR
jgi:hypothetical protein